MRGIAISTTAGDANELQSPFHPPEWLKLVVVAKTEPAITGVMTTAAAITGIGTAAATTGVVCTENLNSPVVVMKSAKN
jgi:hypothetical protein